MDNKISKYFIFCCIIVLPIFFISYSHAEIIKWIDFTTPFDKELEVSCGKSVTVEVTIPKIILDKYDTIDLYVDHNLNHFSYGSPYLQVNDSIWQKYSLTKDSLLKIKTKHLKSGINYFKFVLQKPITGKTSIKQLHFEIQNIEQYNERITKSENSSTVETKEQDSKVIELNKELNDLSIAKDYDESLELNSKESIQNALKRLGYYQGDITGYFDEKTRNSIKAYQFNHGYIPTGYLKKENISILVELGNLTIIQPDNDSKDAKNKESLQTSKNGDYSADYKQNTFSKKNNKDIGRLQKVLDQNKNNKTFKPKSRQESIKIKGIYLGMFLDDGIDIYERNINKNGDVQELRKVNDEYMYGYANSEIFLQADSNRIVNKIILKQKHFNAVNTSPKDFMKVFSKKYKLSFKYEPFTYENMVWDQYVYENKSYYINIFNGDIIMVKKKVDDINFD